VHLGLAVSKGFLEETGRLYGEMSHYVHLTTEQITRRIALVESGRTPGNEGPEQVAELNRFVLRTLAAGYVYLSHSAPMYVTGDFLVMKNGRVRPWSLGASRYIALLDENFDYKHERQSRRDEIRIERWNRVTS
jgi:hypothetical protein